MTMNLQERQFSLILHSLLHVYPRPTQQFRQSACAHRNTRYYLTIHAGTQDYSNNIIVIIYYYRFVHTTTECQTESFGTQTISRTDSHCNSSSINSVLVPNGLVCFDGLTSGSVATFLCNDGYTLIGNKHQTCQNNGSWIGDTPQCKHDRKLNYKILGQTLFLICECSCYWVTIQPKLMGILCYGETLQLAGLHLPLSCHNNIRILFQSKLIAKINNKQIVLVEYSLGECKKTKIHKPRVSCLGWSDDDYCLQFMDTIYVYRMGAGNCETISQCNF